MDDYEKHASLSLKDYLNRGYPLQVPLDSKEKAMTHDRSVLLQPKNRDTTSKSKKQSRPVLVLTYNLANPNLKDIIDRHWHLIQRSKFGNLFYKKTLIAYRRNKNISDTLVRAKCNNTVATPTTRTFTTWKCNFCPPIKDRDTNTYKSNVTGRTYRGPTKYTCQSRNLVYLISCTKCGKQYVGETCRTNERTHEIHKKQRFHTVHR
jgi:hypothetical protein